MVLQLSLKAALTAGQEYLWNTCSNQAALNIAGPAAVNTQQASHGGGSSLEASVGRPQAVRVVRNRETPVAPGIHDVLLFHNGIQAALASVLQPSAGQNCLHGIIRSCHHRSASGSSDTVTVRLCPNRAGTR